MQFVNTQFCKKYAFLGHFFIFFAFERCNLSKPTQTGATFCSLGNANAWRWHRLLGNEKSKHLKAVWCIFAWAPWVVGKQSNWFCTYNAQLKFDFANNGKALQSFWQFCNWCVLVQARTFGYAPLLQKYATLLTVGWRRYQAPLQTSKTLRFAWLLRHKSAVAQAQRLEISAISTAIVANQLTSWQNGIIFLAYKKI